MHIPMDSQPARACGLSHEAMKQGFAVLFQECLSARREDRVLLIYDEAFRAFLDAAVDFLAGNRLSATFLEIPKAYQRALVSWSGKSHLYDDIPAGISQAISESTVVLNCLD